MTIEQERDIAVAALLKISGGNGIMLRQDIATEALAAIAAQASPVAQDNLHDATIKAVEKWVSEEHLSTKIMGAGGQPRERQLNKAEKAARAAIAALAQTGRASAAVPVMTVKPKHEGLTGGKYLTIVHQVRKEMDIDHLIHADSVSAMSWSHALDDRDAARTLLASQSAAQPVGAFCPDCGKRNLGIHTCSPQYAAQPVGDTVEDYDAMLRELCCFLSVGGYNSDGLMSAATANEKIRWGIDHLVVTECERAKKSAQPVGEAVARIPLSFMGENFKGKQWYFDCDDHYIDVIKESDGKYSIYFRDRATGGEAWLDQADMAPPVAQDTGAEAINPPDFPKYMGDNFYPSMEAAYSHGCLTGWRAGNFEPVAQDQDAARWRMHLSLMAKRGHSTHAIGETIDAIDAAMLAEVKS